MEAAEPEDGGKSTEVRTRLPRKAMERKQIVLVRLTRVTNETGRCEGLHADDGSFVLAHVSP